MTTAKNEVFIGLLQENCYIVGGMNLWRGKQKIGGGNLLGGLFVVGEGWVNFGQSGEGTPPPSSQ